MSKKHHYGTSELSLKVAPNNDDEAHWAEVTNGLKMGMNIPKTGQAYVRINISKTAWHTKQY